MDSANKQTAVVAEATVGTTPATPAFLLTRDLRVSGTVQRANSRSMERRSDRMLAAMVQGLNAYQRTIEMPWVRDAASDALWQALLQGTWSTNVLKAGSTRQTVTLEEKYSATTPPYRRFTGCAVDQLSVNFQPGSPGQMNWSCVALTETVATVAIAGATYAVPSPGYDPSTLTDIVVNSLFGLATPKVRSVQLTVSNNLQPQYAAGSADPYAIGLGAFEVNGSVEVYFNQAADYSAFLTKQSGQTFDITIGATTNFKDRIVMGNCDVWSPNVDDEGISGVHNVTLSFAAKYFATDTSAFKITRNAP